MRIQQNNEIEWKKVVLGDIVEFSEKKRKFFIPSENRFIDLFEVNE